MLTHSVKPDHIMNLCPFSWLIRVREQFKLITRIGLVETKSQISLHKRGYFVSDLGFQLSNKSNTIEVATIIRLGCKRKRKERGKHADKDILSTCYLVTQIGSDARGSCCITAVAKHAHRQMKPPHPGATHRERISKAEHVVCVRNAECLVLRRLSCWWKIK